MKNQRLEIIWKGQVVGILEDPRFDNLDLYGHWVPGSNQATKEFLQALRVDDEVEVEVGGAETKLNGSADMGPEDELNIKLRP